MLLKVTAQWFTPVQTQPLATYQLRHAKDGGRSVQYEPM